jgi:hypothetical protein
MTATGSGLEGGHRLPAAGWAGDGQPGPLAGLMHSPPFHRKGGPHGRTDLSASIHSDSSCCPGATEDPAHYVLECPAYSTISAIRDQYGLRYSPIGLRLARHFFLSFFQYVHISQAAAAVDGGEDVSRATLQLFVPSHLQELAAFLRKAYRLSFPRNGSLRLTAQVATDGANALNAPAGGDGNVDTDDGSTSGDDDGSTSDDD